MAADLHERVVAALSDHAAEEGVEFERVGCGVGGRYGCVVDIVDDGGEESRLVSECACELVEKRGGGGLAIGAGDAYQAQVQARRAIPRVRHDAECKVAAADEDIGGRAGILGEERGVFQDYRRRSIGDTLSNEGVPVHGSAALRNEEIARSDASGVELNGVNVDVGATKDLEHIDAME